MTEAAVLTEGQQAPDFELPSSTGQSIRLRDFRGRSNVVLYFYPADDTPGCTKEACFFRDMTPQFAAHDTAILGVSVDSVASHEAFAAKHALPFPLLADEDGQVTRQYGAWNAAAPDGSRRAQARRTTVVIDKDGIVRRVYPSVRVEEHVPEVLRFVDTTLR